MMLRSFIFEDVETDGEGYVFHNQFASFKLVNREEFIYAASLTVVSTNFIMIRFLWIIAIGSLTVSTINLFSNVNDYEEQKLQLTLLFNKER